jgi:hypothetical protein
MCHPWHRPPGQVCEGAFVLCPKQSPNDERLPRLAARSDTIALVPAFWVSVVEEDTIYLSVESGTFEQLLDYQPG